MTALANRVSILEICAFRGVFMGWLAKHLRTSLVSTHLGLVYSAELQQLTHLVPNL